MLWKDVRKLVQCFSVEAALHHDYTRSRMFEIDDRIDLFSCLTLSVEKDMRQIHAIIGKNTTTREYSSIYCFLTWGYIPHRIQNLALIIDMVIRIGNRMNVSAFQDLWARVMFWNCTNRRRVQFQNFQNITSDYTFRNARACSYDFLFIIYSTKLFHRRLFFRLLRVVRASSYSSVFGFFFLSVAYVCQTFNQVCAVSNVFLFFFLIFFKFLNDLLVWQSKPTVRHFFFFHLVYKFGASPVFPWQLPYCTV